MLALRIANSSSHGAFGVPILKTSKQLQLIHDARTASLASDGKLNCAHPPGLSFDQNPGTGGSARAVDTALVS
jgi:hypothetical protein